MRLLIILICLNLKITAKEIPYIDLAKETDRQVIVDKEKGQYLGHPTTTLLSDGKTVLCVYPKGHGKGPIVYKRSNDAGKTRSKRLETPASWTSSKEVPTLSQVCPKIVTQMFQNCPKIAPVPKLSQCVSNLLQFKKCHKTAQKMSQICRV